MRLLYNQEIADVCLLLMYNLYNLYNLYHLPLCSAEKGKNQPACQPAVDDYISKHVLIRLVDPPLIFCAKILVEGKNI